MEVPFLPPRLVLGFQFIEFPSEWGVNHRKVAQVSMGCRFQFIEFPSEWGGEKRGVKFISLGVSNLLSSPASGEWESCFFASFQWEFPIY